MCHFLDFDFFTLVLLDIEDSLSLLTLCLRHICMSMNYSEGSFLLKVDHSQSGKNYGTNTSLLPISQGAIGDGLRVAGLLSYTIPPLGERSPC